MSRPGKLFVGRISKELRSRDLEDMFGRYGRLSRCEIKYGTGRNQLNYGFVDFEDDRDAEDAVRHENGRNIGGASISVEWAKGGQRDGGRFDRGGDGDRYARGRDRSRSRSPRRRRSRSRSRGSRRRSRSRSRDKRREHSKSDGRSRSRSLSKSKSRSMSKSKSASPRRSRSKSGSRSDSASVTKENGNVSD